MFTSWHTRTPKSKCTQCTLLTFTYKQYEKVSENVIVKLQEFSVSATDRRLIWCSIESNWHNNITSVNSNVAVDGKQAHMCAMRQSYKEENLNKINFVFYFLRSVHKFCLVVVFIERLMLLFVIIMRGEITCCQQITIKLC